MTITEELHILRKEMRTLRQRVATVEIAWKKQTKRADRVGKENKDLREKIKELKEKLDSTTNHKDKLVGMIFKTNVKKTNIEGKTKGGQLGHKGCARNKPTRIDERKRCFLSNCPNCKKKLENSEGTYTRVVEELPKASQTMITEYRIEKQYCGDCKKYVHAIPKNTISRCPFGTNIIELTLTLKYRFRLPINKIQEYFENTHNFKISQSGIQNILHMSRKHFGEEYKQILEKIRAAPFKHADETGWRIQGQNGWNWLFATPTEALYTVEETRGSGVPNKILTKKPKGVLVRDDYGVYTKLDMPQQSCWTHLLRVSRDWKSPEAEGLHQKLKIMFTELKEVTDTPFDEKERQIAYDKHSIEIQHIISSKFKSTDTKKVQVRITNQNTNLLTALLYDGVPLTNNHAERQIRPLAVQRKISGGSRSNDGAKTHAVNMSIVQTLTLQGKDIFSGIQEILKLPCHELVGERCWDPTNNCV